MFSLRIALFVMSAAVISGVLTLIVLLAPLGLSGQQMAGAITVAHLVGLAAGFGASCVICNRLLKGADACREQSPTHAHTHGHTPAV